MTKLDAKAKRRISNQWREEFPEFTIWRPMHLLRRVGPVLQGIALDRASSGTEYFPTAHVHSLMTEFPVVSLTLSYRLQEVTGGQRWMSIDDGGDVVREAANALRGQSPLPLDDLPTIDQILAAYLDNVENHHPGSRYSATPEMEDLFLLSGFSQDPSEVLTRANKIAESWRAVPDSFRSKQEWVERTLARAADRRSLQAVIDEQAKLLKVEGIPDSAS